MRVGFKSAILCIFLLNVPCSSAFADSLCDFDGDGKSEIAFVNVNQQGNYDWTAFNPRTGRTKAVIDNFGNASSTESLTLFSFVPLGGRYPIYSGSTNASLQLSSPYKLPARL